MVGLTLYCQDTTINKQIYNKILISLDNCDNEVQFYKNELKNCNLSDSLKSVILNKYINSCDEKLKNKDKENKKNKRNNLFVGIGIGMFLTFTFNLLL